ncbi:uracil-DNA glycosylase family protein [Zeaxanthinibacter sp. PT1]|nr:uracil-DNA glycosylase family protein [Zeaxanthinibacter sp. PT1]MDC6351828.1 uracil-DNA glycosylase family protein [Zeaxanthinibacter sp. PT1]
MKKPFVHTHPFEPFLFEEATRWIVGTLPPPRFTTGDLKPGDVNFCYGSRDGQLWNILDRMYELQLLYEDSVEAVRQRKEFLRREKIGIFDIVDSAERLKVDATDLGMNGVCLRDLLGGLYQYPKVDTLIFTGGNSKNGPEYFFRRLARDHGIKLIPVHTEVPRIHEFMLPGDTENRRIRTVSLTAPSGSANRAVGSMQEYKNLKMHKPGFTTLDFRIQQYSPFFKDPLYIREF